jgi:hypothetical protein
MGPRRRGEWTLFDREELAAGRQILDLAHLFHGHSLNLGTSLKISGGPGLWVSWEVVNSSQQSSFGSFEGGFQNESLTPALLFKSPAEKKGRLFSLFGDWPPQLVPMVSVISPVHFLDTGSVSDLRLSQLWDEVVLTPEEEGVVAAIQIIEPTIERIAFLGERNTRSIFLKLAGIEQRLPLGSMGEGLKRLLVLALHLIPSEGGYLMVDEIDTGLHHTVMVKMWKLVIETARRLGVQVLATTHSLDCVRALAWVQEKNPEIASEVTLHRIERGLPSTVRYTMDELAIAAEHHLEVR